MNRLPHRHTHPSPFATAFRTITSPVRRLLPALVMLFIALSLSACSALPADPDQDLRAGDTSTPASATDTDTSNATAGMSSGMIAEPFPEKPGAAENLLSDEAVEPAEIDFPLESGMYLFSAGDPTATRPMFALGDTPSSFFSILKAAAALNATGGGGHSTSFVLLDLYTGHGMACNAGKPFYPASSIKGLFCHYLVSQVPGSLSEWDRELIEEAIVSSDNDAYIQLVYDHADDECLSWFAGYGIDFSDYMENAYPDVTAAQMAAAWIDAARFLRAGGEEAGWLAGLYSSTSVSFMRDAVTGDFGAAAYTTGDAWNGDPSEDNPDSDPDQASQPASATVLDKAGWIADWDVNALADAGIVEAPDGGRYAFTILSDVPESEAGILAFEDLAAAIWDARGLLD